MNGKKYKTRTLNTQTYVISLEDIDLRTINTFVKIISEKHSLKCSVYIDTDTKWGVITGLLPNDQKALVLLDDESDLRIMHFSDINIDITLDWYNV